MITETDASVKSFLDALNHSLALAAEQKQLAKAANDIQKYKFWDTMHGIVTKACHDTRQPQYEFIKKTKRF